MSILLLEGLEYRIAMAGQTLEGVDDEVDLALEKKVFKLLGPECLASHFMERLDLVLVAGGRKGVELYIDVGEVVEEVLVDDMGLGEGED
jgi:hypothetical protein